MKRGGTREAERGLRQGRVVGGDSGRVGMGGDGTGHISAGARQEEAGARQGGAGAGRGGADSWR